MSDKISYNSYDKIIPRKKRGKECVVFFDSCEKKLI